MDILSLLIGSEVAGGGGGTIVPLYVGADEPESPGVGTLWAEVEGGDITIEAKSITANGTYTAEEGKAFSPVTVNVPNPSTGSLTITENGTYDVTEKASAVVNVSGGITPSKGFVPTSWNLNGLITNGTWYGASIPDLAFSCSSPSSVVGKTMFYEMTNINFASAVTSIGNATFYQCVKLALSSIPNSITSIGNYAFYGCSALALTDIPNGITAIGSEAFRNCQQIAITSIPSGVTRINSRAFASCTSIEELTFDGTPSFVASDAFNWCSNLRTINVPWAEDAVANAPWGATNATINYNYVPTT